MASDDGNRPATGEGAQLVKVAKKAAEKQLIEKIKTDAGGNVVASFSTSATLRIFQEHKTIQHMTPENATALVESNRMQHAVPEEQRTRRSVQQSIRHSIAATVVIVGFLFVYLKPEIGGSVVGLVAILGGGIGIGEFFNREKRKDKRKDQSGAQED